MQESTYFVLQKLSVSGAQHKESLSVVKTPSKAPYATLARKEVNVCIGTAYYARVSEAGNFILPVQLCNVENNWKSSGMMK